jgi:hypothetical protein
MTLFQILREEKAYPQFNFKWRGARKKAKAKWLNVSNC